jgi:hypothetical protein
MTNNTSGVKKAQRKILAGLAPWVLVGVGTVLAPALLQGADYGTIDKVYTAYSFAVIVAAFGMLYALYYLSRMMYHASEARDWKQVSLNVAGIFVAILFVSFALLGKNTDASDAELQQPPQQEVVYMTYSKTCDFCIISESSAETAVAEYKFATGVAVKRVDIDQDNPLANELRQHIKGKGSIVKLHGNNVTAVVFTHGDGKGNPVKTPIETVYRYIQEVSTSGR